jgi:YD repeat-containing protein
VRDEDKDGDLDFVIIGAGSDAAWQSILYSTFADGFTNQDLLTQINLSTGGIINLQYGQGPSAWGNGLTPERPLRAGPLGYRPVLFSLILDDGLGGKVETKYSYGNGYHDVDTKEFRGLEKVAKTFSDGTAQHTWYHVINSDANYFQRYDGLAGKVADEVFTGEDGQVYLWNNYDYEVSQDQGTGVFTTHPREKVAGTCHQDNPYDCVSSKTAFQWTDYGAIKQTDHYGYDGKIRRSTVYQYAENKGDWIVNKPFEKSTSDETGQLLVKESYGYDDKDPGVPPTKGLLTKRTVEDMTVMGLLLQDSSHVATTSYEYDSYGNRTKEVSPEGHIAIWDYSGNGSFFPYTKSVQVGGKTLTTTTVYDLVIGKLKSETDPNGHITEYRYEHFRRLKKVIRPGDTEDSPTVGYTYQDASTPNYVEKTIKLDDSKATIEREYLDGLSRYRGTVGGKVDDYWVHNQVTTYDANGRKKRVYEPFTSPSGSFHTNPSASYTSYDYVDNKLSVIHHPDDHVKSHTYLKNGVQVIDERGVVESP